MKKKSSLWLLLWILNGTMSLTFFALIALAVTFEDEKFFWISLGVLWGWLIAFIYGQAVKEYLLRMMVFWKNHD